MTEKQTMQKPIPFNSMSIFAVSKASNEPFRQ
jgi:hypothetical protein